MTPMFHYYILLACLLHPAIALAQLRSEPTPEEAPAAPLIFRNAGEQSTEPDVEQTVIQLREQLRVIAAGNLSPAEEEDALGRVLSEHPLIFPVDNFEAAPQPATVEEAIRRLERWLAELGPDRSPAESELQPVEVPRRPSQALETEKNSAQDAEPSLRPVKTTRERIKAPEEKTPTEDDSAERKIKVEFLADDNATEELHDDTTVLRSVKSDTGVALLGKLHLWVGGAVQADIYNTEGLFGLQDDGRSDTTTELRRAELVMRASLFENKEIKLQYDVDASLWRDLYWRSVSKETSSIITIGNQKEPMGLDYLMGNKTSTAMERSAPSSAFAAFRGRGIRWNKWWQRSGDNPLLGDLGEAPLEITTTLGVFTDGLDSSKETDLAVTGRLTAGRLRADGSGLHLGVSGTVRDGEFTRIAPRPEVQLSERVLLASPRADTQFALSLEGLYTRGPLHTQAELTVSNYRGGNVDAQGLGGYIQVGWFLTGEMRKYRPRWGLWAPLRARSKHVVEVFSRFSYTYGDDEESSWNDLRALTLGSSWYYRNLRATLNLHLAQTHRDVEGEDSGHALVARLQYIF